MMGTKGLSELDMFFYFRFKSIVRLYQLPMYYLKDYYRVIIYFYIVECLIERKITTTFLLLVMADKLW